MVKILHSVLAVISITEHGRFFDQVILFRHTMGKNCNPCFITPWKVRSMHMPNHQLITDIPGMAAEKHECQLKNDELLIRVANTRRFFYKDLDWHAATFAFDISNHHICFKCFRIMIRFTTRFTSKVQNLVLDPPCVQAMHK